MTGGAGRLGAELLPRLRAAGFAVNAPGVTELDILDERALAAAFVAVQPDLTLHLAAYTNVSAAEAERAECWRVNVVGTRNVARLAPGRLAHLSTDYVFDGQTGNYREDDPPNPVNYYALTKLVAEEAARAHPHALILRTSFKPSLWPHPVAFEDQFTSADYVDVIAGQLAQAIVAFASGRVAPGALHIATERKSVFELARRRNPDVRPGSRLSVSTPIPPDVSLNTERWRSIRAALGGGQDFVTGQEGEY